MCAATKQMRRFSPHALPPALDAVVVGAPLLLELLVIGREQREPHRIQMPEMHQWMSLHRKCSHNGNALELRCLLIFTGILFETQETRLGDDSASPLPHEKCRPNSDKSTTNHRRELGPTGNSRLVRSNRKRCADIGTRPIRDTDSYPHIVLG